MAMTVEVPARDLNEENSTGWKPLVCATRCSRCGGLLVAEPCTDFWDDVENLAVRRCVQCGALVDQVILQNRQRRLTAGLPTSRRRSVVSRSENRI
jgi:hypothetical protein